MWLPYSHDTGWEKGADQVWSAQVASITSRLNCWTGHSNPATITPWTPNMGLHLHAKE